MSKRQKIRAYLIDGLFFITGIGLQIIARELNQNIEGILLLLSFLSITIGAYFGGFSGGLVATLFSSLVLLFSSGNESVNTMAIGIIFLGLIISRLIDRLKAKQESAIKYTNLSIKNEAYLRRVLDNLFVFVGVCNPKGILEEVNLEPVKQANLKFKNVINKNLTRTYWWSYSNESKNKLKKAIKNAKENKEVRYDTLMRTKDGKLTMVDFSIKPLKNKENKVEYLVVSAVDIDQRTEALNDNLRLVKELKKNKKITDNIVAGIPGVVWELRKKNRKDNFKLSFVSEYQETMLGYEIGICRTKPDFWQEVIVQEDLRKVIKEIKKVYSTKKTKNLSISLFNG